MGVADTAGQLVASLVKNREEDKETLQTHEHHSQRIRISPPAIDQVARTSASESSSDPHACQNNPLIELLQWQSSRTSINGKFV